MLDELELPVFFMCWYFAPQLMGPVSCCGVQDMKMHPNYDLQLTEVFVEIWSIPLAAVFF